MYGEDESKIMRRRPRTSNYGFDHKKGAAEQDNQCAVAALAHFNQQAASKLVSAFADYSCFIILAVFNYAYDDLSI